MEPGGGTLSALALLAGRVLGSKTNAFGGGLL